jgi:hypothetical protein
MGPLVVVIDYGMGMFGQVCAKLVGIEILKAMDKLIKFIFILFTVWVALHGFIKFLPQYATQLPHSIYSFLYHLTQT